MKAPYTKFGQTRMLPVVVYLNNKQLKEVFEWDEELWVERPEDWYAFMSESLKYKRVRVIDRNEWLKGEICKDN